MAKPKASLLRGSGLLLLLASLIGCLGGLLGAGFQNGVLELTRWFMGSPEAGNVADAGHAFEPSWLRPALPALGGLVAGLCLLAIRNQRSPFGIADIVGLVALRRGTIRIRQSVMQILSSACTIASGGSIGREGANSQISATIGASLARVFRLNSRSRSVLLGCGVAAGVAFSYNAPIAAAIFVMEAVLGNFAMDVFAPVVLAAVISTVMRHHLLSPEPIYLAEGVGLSSNLWFSALVLGAVCGCGGVLFRFCLRTSRRAFGAIPAPLFVRMALGGLVVGIIGYWFPETWGNGIANIREITVPNPEGLPGLEPTAGLIFSLVLWKVVATCATAGSGGLGGIFTPNLVVGAAFGAFFANAVGTFIPEAGIGEGRIAFALIGMAGLVAATNHTPITAVVLVFELTRDYELVPPIMLCCIIASVVARMIDRDSYYTEPLSAKGESLPQGLEDLAVHTNYVRDIMRRDPATVSGRATFDDVLDTFINSRHSTVYVTGEDGGLLGHIRLHDVKVYINDPTLGSVVIAADLTRPVVPARPADSLAAVLRRFDDPELEELPVVEGTGTGRLLARLTRRDVIACLSDEVLGQRALRARFKVGGETVHVELPPDYELARVPVPDELVGRALDSVELRADAGLIALLVVRRNEEGIEERVAAEPQVVLEAGAELIVLGSTDAIAAFRERGMPVDEGD